MLQQSNVISRACTFARNRFSITKSITESTNKQIAIGLAFTFTFTGTLPSACKNQAAAVLGFTQVSWDNLSGREPQPLSMMTLWKGLSDNEKAAAGLLGYEQLTWDNDSGLETQPAKKTWAELSECG